MVLVPDLCQVLADWRKDYDRSSGLNYWITELECPKRSSMEGRSPACMGVPRQTFQKKMDCWDVKQTKLFAGQKHTCGNRDDFRRVI